MEEYNLRPLIEKICVLFEFRTCIYGLLQAVRFTYTKLVKHLEDGCYFPTGHAPGPFFCFTQPTTFNLAIDNFGNKFAGKHNADHLTNTFKKYYNVTVVWNG